MFWGYLLHLSYNMWADRRVTEVEAPYYSFQPFLRCEDAVWEELTARMPEAGVDLLVIDLGDGVRYESHPEIAVQGAWSVDRLRNELFRLRDLGIEPIPKLNFSTCHDAWLGPYAHMVSAPEYYKVCRDLIAEVVDIFDRPRLFHLGMDEENWENQRYFEYVVIRQYDLWWNDLAFYCGALEERGVRPWVWSDDLWHHPGQFLDNMPRSVLQSNWYYGAEFAPEDPMVAAYRTLEERGYDQVPTGSNWDAEDNFPRTVRFAREIIAPERLSGFLQTVWRPTLAETAGRHLAALEQVRQARTWWESTS